MSVEIRSPDVAPPTQETSGVFGRLSRIIAETYNTARNVAENIGTVAYNNRKSMGITMGTLVLALVPMEEVRERKTESHDGKPAANAILERITETAQSVLSNSSAADEKEKRTLVIEQEVDDMEVNYYYDDNGRLVFCQIIFWEFDEETGDKRVRAWRLQKSESQLPSKAGEWHQATWPDGDTLRRVKSRNATVT